MCGTPARHAACESTTHHSSDITHSYNVSDLIHVSDMTHSYVSRLLDMLHVSVCSVICVTWLMRTHLYMGRDAFILMTWRILMCDMTRSYVHSYVSHDLWGLIHMWEVTHAILWPDAILMCDTTRSYVSHLLDTLHVCLRGSSLLLTIQLRLFLKSQLYSHFIRRIQ